MFDYKTAFGIASVLLTVIAYVPYIRDILKGKTTPHLFTWLIWLLLTAIAFTAQFKAGAGPGAWATGSVVIADTVVFLLALLYGKRLFSIVDWVALLLGVLALILWKLTNDPFLSVILVTIATVIGFIPTFRKSFLKPQEETWVTYILNAVKQALGLLALQSTTLVTVLFPASLVILNGCLGIFLITRRHQLNIRIPRSLWNF